MLQLQFKTIAEPSIAGEKWKFVFDYFWPSYRLWLAKSNFANTINLYEAKAALEKYMPEMLPTYHHLCEVANADEVAATFLTGFQPPAYISACAQAVTTSEEIQLVRNYDYSAKLLEGAFMLTNWNGKKVMGTNESLVGLVDGMNDDGLVVSLTFGGRKEVGYGFGISFILRYILEFCSNTKQAIEALQRIPSHMSYNVTVVDKAGNFNTVLVAPDRDAIVTNAAFSTNHQQTIDWEENAIFNKTRERALFLENALAYKGLTNDKIVNLFLSSPLYNEQFHAGFGTLYTAVYQPELGIAKLLWKEQAIIQQFNHFTEENILVHFKESNIDALFANNPDTYAAEYMPEYPEQLVDEWQSTVTEIMVNAMVNKGIVASDAEKDRLRTEILQQGEVSWEIIADYWEKIGIKNWEK